MTRRPASGSSSGANRPESSRASNAAALTAVHQRIITCNRCDRLRNYCTRIAADKKAAHREDTYWGRPVPGFGDPRARVLVLGLAPAAHGANRTGRVFTGDGSGDFLMRAMHGAGFANITTSRHANDGLRLSGAYIAAAVRCAPPDNKPLPSEIADCHAHLVDEVAALPGVAVIVARPDRVRRSLAAAGGSGNRDAPEAGVRPWTRLSARGRAGGDRVVSSQSSKHEHEEAHAGDARGRLHRCGPPRPTDMTE